MNIGLSEETIDRYARQIILKNVGPTGQKKILNSKVLIIGGGGLGSPVSDSLSRAGVGRIGIADYDKVNLSNIHRQSMFSSEDIGKYKVDVIKKRIKLINPKIKVKTFKKKINKKNIDKILKDYEIIVDGSDNFETKFLLNEFCIKHKKFLVVGAISKFDGHLFVFNFNKIKVPCLKCFYQNMPPDETLNCETNGVMGPVAGIIGNLQSNEVLKNILNIKSNLNSYILIINLIDLTFRKVKFLKKRNCVC